MRQPKPIECFVDSNGCYICTSHAQVGMGYKRGQGYPVIRRNGIQYRLNRYIYEQTYGTIPKGLHVLHKCDNPKCINPAHLFLGTHKENMQDKVKKNRQTRLKGEDNGRSKLTEKEVLEIRRSDLSRHELAEIYKVTPQSINDIRRYRTWAHIQEI